MVHFRLKAISLDILGADGGIISCVSPPLLVF